MCCGRMQALLLLLLLHVLRVQRLIAAETRAHRLLHDAAACLKLKRRSKRSLRRLMPLQRC